jgi:hypothetical protein
MILAAWWQLQRWLRHPVNSYHWRQKARHRPRTGDLIEDCRRHLSRVAVIDGDDITTTDGFRCSWMHCCDWPEELPRYYSENPGRFVRGCYTM